MSRKILCPKCKEAIERLAKQYDELFESKEGEAIEHMICDDCGKPIQQNGKCFASVLLPNKSHFNYEIQKPSTWASDYIN